MVFIDRGIYVEFPELSNQQVIEAIYHICECGLYRQVNVSESVLH